MTRKNDIINNFFQKLNWKEIDSMAFYEVVTGNLEAEDCGKFYNLTHTQDNQQ